jgi:hypothetical protein
MIEHDRNPASQQAGYPLVEDGPPLGAFQQVAGRDLTCRPGRSARDYNALPVLAGGALIVWRAASHQARWEPVRDSTYTAGKLGASAGWLVAGQVPILVSRDAA